jgi:hypothetical protein
MKKIMFSERYGLEQAVLARRKNMTRRKVNTPPDMTYDFWNPVMGIDDKGKVYFTVDYCDGSRRDIYPQYQIGEELAVAQSYETLANSRYCSELGMMDTPTTFKKEFCGKGWGNKMFVRADLMPHRIRITNINAERLQDISEEDAMREGIFKYDKPPLHHEMDMFAPWAPYVRPYKWDSDNLVYRCNARAAFAYLIDKISGGGTWNRNPWVFAYEFELVR